MAETAVTVYLQPHYSPGRSLFPYYFISSYVPITTVLQLPRCRTNNRLFHLEKSRNCIHEARAWGANPRSMGDYGDDIDEDDDDEEEDDEDRSLDLLIRFVENVFRKVSRKARRAVKSVLPVPISTRLVTIVRLKIRLQFRLCLLIVWELVSFLP
ncbi:hypothetical protein ACS0TY_002774 [Phlomoides rotata]